MSKKSTGHANPAIDRAMKAMLKEITDGKNEDGEKYSLLDRMRLMDRVLKWEAIKTKMEGSDWGSEFDKDEK